MDPFLATLAVMSFLAIYLGSRWWASYYVAVLLLCAGKAIWDLYS